MQDISQDRLIASQLHSIYQLTQIFCISWLLDGSRHLYVTCSDCRMRTLHVVMKIFALFSKRWARINDVIVPRWRHMILVRCMRELCGVLQFHNSARSCLFCSCYKRSIFGYEVTLHIVGINVHFLTNKTWQSSECSFCHFCKSSTQESIFPITSGSFNSESILTQLSSGKDHTSASQ